jgi:hypothetical protein
MTRRLLNLLTVLSLVLLAGAMAMWVRSHWVTESYFWERRPNEPGGFTATSFFSAPGATGAGRFRMLYRGSDAHANAQYVRENLAGWKPHESHSVPWMTNSLPRVLSQSRTYPGTDWIARLDAWSVQVPYWMIVLAASALPAWRLARWSRRRRRPGLCPSRGYNLTGNVSGVCPECGGAMAPEA